MESYDTMTEFCRKLNVTTDSQHGIALKQITFQDNLSWLYRNFILKQSSKT